MRVLLLIFLACFSFVSFAETSDMWVGSWVEGEFGAKIYNKIRITPNILSFAPGGNSDAFYFEPSESKIWCHVKYEVVSHSQGDTYPDERASHQEISHRMKRSYKIVLLMLEHSKCTNFKYLQMAFPSDIARYAEIIRYDENHRKLGEFNYHRIDTDGR